MNTVTSIYLFEGLFGLKSIFDNTSMQILIILAMNSHHNQNKFEDACEALLLGRFVARIVDKYRTSTEFLYNRTTL